MGRVRGKLELMNAKVKRAEAAMRRLEASLEQLDTCAACLQRRRHETR